jgi:hypothetical protein
MGRAAAWSIGVLACLVQVAPGGALDATLAVTMILAAVLLALLIRAQVPQPLVVVEGARTSRRRSADEARQYVPAAAGRPQPRAPGQRGS